jgi:hypothetical protein
MFLTVTLEKYFIQDLLSMFNLLKPSGNFTYDWV